MAFKEVLVGHFTLVVLALLGMALYAGSYGLMGMRSVAILEMWMATTHLGVAVLCCLAQVLRTTFWLQKEPLDHVAESQTSLFLGIACAVTVLGYQCLQYGRCAAYYGAAAFPKLAGVGSIAWAWIMYLSSLSCQSWENGGLSLGLQNRGALLVALVMALLPPMVLSKLSTTCGWVCSDPSCDATGHLLLIWGGAVVTYLGVVTGTTLLQLLGPLLLEISLVWSASGSHTTYYLTAMAFAGYTFVTDLLKLKKHHRFHTGDKKEEEGGRSWGSFFHFKRSKKKNATASAFAVL